MEPIDAGDAHSLLEEQYELHKEVRTILEHELHKLQVEEEMLMRKFYQATTLGVQEKGIGTNNDATTGDDDVQTESRSKAQ